MPTYEYKCKVCDDRFEIEQSFTDDTLTVLDGCSRSDDGDHQLKKVFSAVGISFKGDGFYRNDARSSSSSSSTSSENGNGNGTKDGGGSKSDSGSDSSSSSTSSSSSSSDSSSSSSSDSSSSTSKATTSSGGD